MDFITQNGQKNVTISISSLENSFVLQDSILVSLKTSGFDVEGAGIDFEMNVSDILPSILSSGLGILSSKEVRESLFSCFSRCTYNGEKITHKTFESEEAREDYYEVAMACVKVNCAPFFKSLLSAFAQMGLDSEKVKKILK